MKVMDQLIFLGELHGLDATTASKRAHAWCERMEITEAIPKKTEELSKGMQQKIQFIAALLHEPDLIIMDEPFSGLDPVNATLLQDTLVDLRQQGKAVLFSTHRMDQVEKLCDAIALISTAASSSPAPCARSRPATPQPRPHHLHGDDSFLNHPAIASAKNYTGHAEINLATRPTPPPTPRPCSPHAVNHGTRITQLRS